MDVMRFFAQQHPQGVRGRYAKEQTLKSVAVEQGKVDVARFLASERFCRVGCTDKQGCTPLDLVLRRGDKNSLRMLQAFGNVEL